MRRILVITFFLLLPVQGLGTTRYVSQNGGTFSGGTACNGQTTISAATFNSTTNSPGDTDYLCGTITESAGGNIITVKGGGSAGSPVTVIFDTGAQLSAPYCNSLGNDSGCLIISTPSSPQSYIIVDGGTNTPCGWTNSGGAEQTCNGSIVNTNSGTGLTTGTSTNAVEMEECSHCEVRNLGIYDIYVQSGGDTNANPQYENCFVFSGSNNLIHDNRMHDVGWCGFYNMQAGDSNNQFYQNEIYNTPHPMFLGTAEGISGTATNLYTYSNYFHDYENWNTSACTYHVEGIHSSGPSSAPFPVLNGVFIYNNKFGPGSGTCLFSDIYLSPNTGSAGSAALVNQSYVFNNLIIVDGDTSDYGITVGGGNGNVVYNNTIVNNYTSSDTGAIGLNWSNISQNSGYAFTYENNALQGFHTILNDDTPGSEDAYGATITGNYNAYSQCPSNGIVEGNCFTAWVSGGTSTWTTFVSASGESHSVNTGLFSGTYCCTGTLNLSSGYQPDSPSAAIGAGTNLYNTCEGQGIPGLGALCSDWYGNARPRSGAWDIGAFIGLSGAPSPPTSLTAVPH